MEYGNAGQRPTVKTDCLGSECSEGAAHLLEWRWYNAASIRATFGKIQRDGSRYGTCDGWVDLGVPNIVQVVQYCHVQREVEQVSQRPWQR